jgi:hypothetical protein
MAGAAAGLVWSAPRIKSAVPAAAGTPMPTQSPEAAPPVVAPNVVEPIAVEPNVVEANVVEPTVEAATIHPERGLAFTGENTDTMTTAGVVSLGAGALLHHAGKRDRAREVGDELDEDAAEEAGEATGQKGATSWVGPLIH